MKHYYSDAQKAATNILIKSYRDDTSIRSIDSLGSVYLPLTVFLRIKRIEIGNDGGGGIVTDYIAIDYDGFVTRDANVNLVFESNKARMLVFSELIPINLP